MTAYRFRGGPRDGEMVEVPGSPPLVYVPNPADLNAVAQWTEQDSTEVRPTMTSPIAYTRERLVRGGAEYWTADYRDREVRMQRSMRERVTDLEREVSKLKAMLGEE